MKVETIFVQVMASLYTDNNDVALKITLRNKLLGTLNTLILREATATKNGLMSSADKSRLDTLYALLGVESDADVVVNTINEVLAIFSAYPEGADLVNALSGKVDKVARYLVYLRNDFTDILKAKVR